MADETKTSPTESKPRLNSAPLVFISHDSRDADLAEAFSKLLRSVSAGMLKSFRSSDKKGAEGIEFGDEWYKRLMEKLDSASDVVCLLTERSLERPWILYEAGVAKGKLETPVVGIALGIPLASANAGPFYQFQNSDDSEESLTKLILQLVRRVPGLEPDHDVVKAQVKAFKAQVDELIAKLKKHGPAKKEEPPSEPATAKVLEELKVIVRDLPTKIQRRSDEDPEFRRSRRLRRHHPMMIREMMHMLPSGPDEPLSILIAASLVRDEFPWIYEIAREAYDAIQSKSKSRREHALATLRRMIEFSTHGPFMDDMMDKESHMMMHELTHQIGRIVEHHIRSFKAE